MNKVSKYIAIGKEAQNWSTCF